MEQINLKCVPCPHCPCLTSVPLDRIYNKQHINNISKYLNQCCQKSVVCIQSILNNSIFKTELSFCSNTPIFTELLLQLVFAVYSEWKIPLLNLRYFDCNITCSRNAFLGKIKKNSCPYLFHFILKKKSITPYFVYLIISSLKIM